ncbi:MAG TPA: pimeloyl-ACP methyl ester esterase BioH [Candidatus Saccharimonadia bacterium]|nr:pimeloyl-ACP methyl ester esterase BioH [Candidatus Saccharimonadia bacterium]
MLTATHPALHVETTGEGTPLVMLHGWAMHGGLFAPIVPALSQRHRVHVVDLPGHGRSGTERPWTLARVVDALEQRFADAGTVSVLGWSLGGAVAIAWARRFPARIDKLVLVSTTPRFVAAGDWPCAMTAETLARFADELRVSFRQTLLRFLALQVRGSDEGRVVLAALRGQLFERGEPAPSVLAESLAALREIDLRDDARRLPHAALVVTGAQDTLAPAEAGAWLAAALPRGRLHAFDAAAHAPFLSHRDAFVDVVAAFLRDG